MSPAQWGPPTWILLHAIAEKINESFFPDISVQLFQIISQICKNLPCPECAAHATQFLNSVKMTPMNGTKESNSENTNIELRTTVKKNGETHKLFKKKNKLSGTSFEDLKSFSDNLMLK